MEEDYKKTVRLSSRASDIADKIFESGIFDDRLAVCRFALSYALKNYASTVDPMALDRQYDSGGFTYNVGSLDDDNYLIQIIPALYPECKTPYRYIRGLMIFGLEELGKLLDEGKLYPISSIM